MSSGALGDSLLRVVAVRVCVEAPMKGMFLG